MDNQQLQDVVVFQMGRLLGAAISKKPFDINDFVEPVMKAADDRVAELDDEISGIKGQLGECFDGIEDAPVLDMIRSTGRVFAWAMSEKAEAETRHAVLEALLPRSLNYHSLGMNSAEKRSRDHEYLHNLTTLLLNSRTPRMTAADMRAMAIFVKRVLGQLSQRGEGES